MSAKKKAKTTQNDLMDSAHKIWLAGLGALAMAEEESGKLFQSLMEKGQTIESRGKDQVEKAKGTVAGMKTVAESYWETLERTVDDQVTVVIHRLGVPTKGEIEDLTKKVEDLTVSIEKMRVKPATRKTPAATKKTTKTAKRTTTAKPKAKTTK